MAHSKEAHGKKAAMGEFNAGHWEKKPGSVMLSDGKYTEGEMSNPEHLKESVNKLSAYVKSHKAKH